MGVIKVVAVLVLAAFGVVAAMAAEVSDGASEAVGSLPLRAETERYVAVWLDDLSFAGDDGRNAAIFPTLDNALEFLSQRQVSSDALIGVWRLSRRVEVVRVEVAQEPVLVPQAPRVVWQRARP